jgi:hypothetical protein
LAITLAVATTLVIGTFPSLIIRVTYGNGLTLF